MPLEKLLSQTVCALINIPGPSTDNNDSDIESPDEENLINDIDDEDFHGNSNENSPLSNLPKLCDQAELNNLVRDLDLSKESSELLASRLAEKHLLSLGTTVTFYRYRDKEIQPFYKFDGKYAFCSNIKGLMAESGVDLYNSSDWR